jgi:predicted ABC-type ATPase
LRRASAERPIFWLVAGPNGSGKSSVYQDADIEAFARSVWIINPDLLTARIREIEGLALRAANLQAVQRIEAWLEASIRAHQTVGVETVLSTSKYRRLVEAAKALRFEVRLTYVILDSAERSIERVRLRVKKGGHDVPKDKIVERYARSLEQLPWFLDQAEQVSIFDNSGAQPRLNRPEERLRHHARSGRLAADRDGRPARVARTTEAKTGPS